MPHRLALTDFAAIMIGAVAGGIGGIAGAPGTISTVEIEGNVDVLPTSGCVAVITSTPAVMVTATP